MCLEKGRTLALLATWTGVSRAKQMALKTQSFGGAVVGTKGWCNFFSGLLLGSLPGLEVTAVTGW